MKEPVMEISGLDIGYNKRNILSGINAAVCAGDFIGIVGPNGAGKSTLLKVLRGVQPPNSGVIKLYGKRLSEYADKQLAQKIAYLQQNENVPFEFTAQDIVLMGRYPYLKWWEQESDEDKRLALECLAYTGTAELASRPINAVSGGQRQRILLARVLAQQTPVLFLDEPTTGLDMVYNEEIFRFTKELVVMGKTVLMIVHELNMAAKYCNRIWLVGGGVLLADAPPGKAFTEKLLSKAYNADIQITRDANNRLDITTKADIDSLEEYRTLLHKICGCHTS